MSPRKPSLDDELRVLDEATQSPRSEAARAALLAALRSPRALVAARAARIVKEHLLDGYEAALTALFARLIDAPAPAKADPYCHAKLAALEALDYVDSLDAAPFLRAARQVQLEGADTAGGLRARAIFALARLGHPDFDLAAARLLDDQLAPVRQAALDALAHRGDRAGAGLALLKLRQGDKDPLVTLAAMHTLVALAPAYAVIELRAALDDDDDERRELAALALGQARGDEPLAALLAALERCTASDGREPLLRGIGLHRSDRALHTLLEVIAEAHPADARLAISALVARRFEPGLADKVRAAAARNPRGDLVAVADALLRV